MPTIIDGSIWTKLYTDSEGRSWEMLQRDGGSISLYYTRPNVGAHFVVYDTLDNQPPAPALQPTIQRLTELHDAIEALLHSF